MNPVPRGTFSLWESPNAILQGPNATIVWTGPNAAHLSRSNIKEKTIVSPSIAEHGFRGTLREDETWAKIARTKSRRAGGGTDGVSTQTSSLISNPSEAERTKHCLGVMFEAETDAAVSACSSKQRCRCYYSSSDGSAVTATDLGPMATTAGTPALLPTSYCWNPFAYENSLLGKPASSTAHPSIAGRQTPGPSGAPSDQHHIDDALDGIMSDLRRVSSTSDRDPGSDGARGLDVSTRMLPSEALLFVQTAVGIEEPRSSTNITASPDMDSKRISTARLTDILRESRVVSFPKDGWQPAPPTAASPKALTVLLFGCLHILAKINSSSATSQTSHLIGFPQTAPSKPTIHKKNEVVRSVAAIIPSPSPSPFDWGLESSSFSPMSNIVLKHTTGGFPPSSW
ncbi:unnamed protein product [Ectocarpus sp. CCAP 1310/34]|nr:unnamed protein product [Ectocarpus sp. CCAP 1310/34]